MVFMQICEHARTEILARRDGVDYLRCLDCDQVFEGEDLVQKSDAEIGLIFHG